MSDIGIVKCAWKYSSLEIPCINLACIIAVSETTSGIFSISKKPTNRKYGNFISEIS
ncbi:MAG: hypothetical protein BWX61_00893 [Bacteroidetes bacterium ADurb.Bin035]|nr:MAG: hypothetical protein BWX61_00893 [Bacteroidetes bacterium ADurb.Bin035]